MIRLFRFSMPIDSKIQNALGKLGIQKDIEQKVRAGGDEKSDHEGLGPTMGSNFAQEKEHEQKSEKQAPPPGEKKDLRDSRISVLVFILAGAAMALLSSVLHSSGISNWITGFTGIILLIVLAVVMTKMFRRKLKFFYASLFIYLLIWLVTWIFLYNL